MFKRVSIFSIKSAYAVLTSPSQENIISNPLFKKVSRWKSPARIRSHLWNLVHGCLLTSEERFRRGIAQDNVCPRCSAALESLMHLMRDCEVVQNFWNQCIDRQVYNKFFSMGLHQWLDWNLSSKKMGSSSCNWYTFFRVAV